MEWWKTTIGKLVEVYVRPRNIGVSMLRAGIYLMAVLVGGFGISIVFSDKASDTGFSFSWGNGLGPVAFYTAFAIATFIIIIGVIISKRHAALELTEKQISRVIVVELRGLIDTSDSPLIKAVPTKIAGRRESCLIDIRRLVAGSWPNISEALQELSHVQRQIRHIAAGSSREHITVVAGGVMQVSLLFYAGVLLDDEGRVMVFEWERANGKWEELNQPDSGRRFSIVGLEEVDAESPDVVVAVSASYQVDSVGIANTFPHIPVVHLRLPDPRPNTLMSGQMQDELARQFTTLMGELANKSVGTVHLILAAPASLCIRLGRAYDRRNMPNINCYQRERDQIPAYPWYVRIDASNPAQFERTPAPVIAQ